MLLTLEVWQYMYFMRQVVQRVGKPYVSEGAQGSGMY